VSDAVGVSGAAEVGACDASAVRGEVGQVDAEGGGSAGAREAEEASSGGSAPFARVEVGQEWADGLNPGDVLVVEEIDGLDRAVVALRRGVEVVAEDFMRWPVNRWQALVEMQRLELLS
jgi:hypothetical protein